VKEESMKYVINIITISFLIFVMGTCIAGSNALAFDHMHRDWDRLLKKHVVITNNGSTSWVRYANFQKDRAALKSYLNKLSSVKMDEFNSWSKDQQLSFLINAYNAFTIELVLTRYPDIDSIKDIGSFFQTPWRKNFFTLFGKKQNLDGIEHGMIRKKGVYDDPRIHFAVNCASIGCPALRNEAFVYTKLNQQLEQSMILFLSDPSRNRYDTKTKTLEVSKIFDWYKEDFSRGTGRFDSLKGFFATFANLFTNQPMALKTIRERNADITFLKYDWNLNDYRKLKEEKE